MTAAEHAAALAEIRQLWSSPVGTQESDRLELLLTLVDAYEDEQIWPATPIEGGQG